MPSQLMIRSPLSSGPRDRIAEGRGLVLRERGRTVVLYLEGARCALEELPPVGQSAGNDRERLLGIGPDAWLLVAEGGATASPGLNSDRFEVALDQSHAWTRLGISGPSAPAVLAKGCVLDLDSQQFPPGACAVTGFARMRVVLWRPAEHLRYDLLVGRSYALSLWEWLSEAALEFRCEEVKPCRHFLQRTN
ncbi:MAG TPA: sarcosine oxidase subunit gamma family protein [Stellaceae bacterium]|nr:sarcosine oxidase subunit gamma family protein [Stellaceae bacterium]